MSTQRLTQLSSGRDVTMARYSSIPPTPNNMPQQFPQHQATPQHVSLTEAKIKEYLHENNLLLQLILSLQNQGKLKQAMECQQKLQRNLLYLAAIADMNPVLSSRH